MPILDIRSFKQFKVPLNGDIDRLKMGVGILHEVIPKLLLAWQGLWQIPRIPVVPTTLFSQCNDIHEQVSFLYSRYPQGMRTIRSDIEASRVIYR